MKPLEKYARLIVESGVNIQQGQTLIIRSQIDTADFAKLCLKKAYEAGAGNVYIIWTDDETDKLRYRHTDLERFKTMEPWLSTLYNGQSEEDAAFLIISSSDPENLKDIDPEKISTYDETYTTALKEFYERLLNNHIAWCIAALPSPSWAAKVFPELPVDAAMDKLMDAILEATRANKEDPVKAWREHQEAIDRQLEFLNGHRFKSLRYRNSLGTDFTIELAENHIWYGGADTHQGMGYKFIANMPTEEVYTAPAMAGANGMVVASRPLSFNGQLIEDFWFEFKDGKVVDFGAKSNRALLASIFDKEEQMRFLGEVALVPYDSPISNQGFMYYKTLFDENASCHLALGSAYPICIEKGEDMTNEERLDAGINVANGHTDFMIGTKDLSVTGIKEDGTEIPVFKDGNFA